MCSTRNRNELHSTSSVLHNNRDSVHFTKYVGIWRCRHRILFFTFYLVLHSLFSSSISVRDIFSHFIKLTTFQPFVRKRIDFLGISHFSVCLTKKREREEKMLILFRSYPIDRPQSTTILYHTFCIQAFTFRCTKCRVFFTLTFGWQRFHFMLNNRIFSLPLHYFTLLLVNRTQWIFKSLSNSTIYRFSMHVLSIGLISLFFLFCCCDLQRITF